MAPHYSLLAWKIPWAEEPGRLQSMGSLRVGHDWNDLAAAAAATEAEDIKKRSQECTELYKKDLQSPDNHDGVITHLEPDILECKVKWALGSIITKKASGGVMEFQLSYFKSWKMMLWKYCTQYASKLGKLSSGHRTGKGQFSFQSQRKAMPKNVQTTTQLYSSHTLGK